METFLGLTQRQVKKIIFASYLLYFSLLGVGVVLYTVENFSIFLGIVTIGVPILHFSFIISGEILKERVSFFEFYEAYPIEVKIPQTLLFMSDWLMAFALGLAIATWLPLDAYRPVAGILVMLSQLVCFAK